MTATELRKFLEAAPQTQLPWVRWLAAAVLQATSAGEKVCALFWCCQNRNPERPRVEELARIAAAFKGLVAAASPRTTELAFLRFARWRVMADVMVWGAWAGKGCSAARRLDTAQLDKDFSAMSGADFDYVRVGCEDVRTTADGVHFTSQGARKVLCAHQVRIGQFFTNE